MAKKLNLLISVNVLLLIFGYIVFRSYAEWNAREWMDKLTSAASGTAAVELKAVNVNLLDSFINLVNVDIIPVRKDGDSLPVNIHIDDVVVHDADREHLPPRNLHIVMNGVSVEFDPESRLGARLKELGYEKLIGTLELDYIYDPDKGELQLKTLSPEIDGMGLLIIKSKLSEVDLESILKAGLAGLENSFKKVIVNDIEMHYDDDSLVSRLVRVGADARGKEAAAYKKELELQLKATLSDVESSLGDESSVALTDFFKYPRTRRLTVTALPSRLVSLGGIFNESPLHPTKSLSTTVSSTERNMDASGE